MVTVPGPVNPRGSETVLLAEANEVVRCYAAMVLRGQGYTVLEANNGTDALRTAEGHEGPIRLLVVNAELPPAGGIKLAEAVLGCQKQARVLLLCGPGAAEALRGAGPVQAMPLSFTWAELAQTVRQVLDSPSPEAPPGEAVASR
jgi:two-component system chemotaxis response regulator CheY